MTFTQEKWVTQIAVHFYFSGWDETYLLFGQMKDAPLSKPTTDIIMIMRSVVTGFVLLLKL